MNIGLISDTHIPEAIPELPVQIRQVFADTELILHAGDLHCLAVLDWLEEIAPVLAARGNGDSGSGGRPVVPQDPRLQEAQVVRYHGWTIGVVHEVLDPIEMPHWPIERTMQRYFGCHTESVDIPMSKLSGAMAMSGSSIPAVPPIHGTCKPNPAP
jgi:putative phosphoesterase